MILYKFKLFFLLIILPLFLDAQSARDTNDNYTISVRYKELLDIDYRFKMILDDFIDNMPPNQQKSYILINIDGYITYRAQPRLIDSLYEDNIFQKGIYSFPYSIYIEDIDKESNNMLFITNFDEIYKYHYNGYEVVIVSPLHLRFPWLGPTVVEQYQISREVDNTSSYFSIYAISDYEVEKINYIKLYSQPSGVLLKKRYYEGKKKSDMLKEKQ